jgi:hypothetical protein
MKTVMVLAVNFPPTGGVGVIRTLKMVKYLPDYGWRPIVITPQSGTKNIKDNSLHREIPEGTIVHRPYFFDYRVNFPKILTKLFRPIDKRIFFPDKYLQWNKAAFRYISQKIIPKEKIDLIYTSVGPYSTMLLAHALKKQFHIPVIIDFRDPFSFNQYVILDKKEAFRKKAQKIEKEIFKDIDHINIVSKTWRENYETLYPETSSKLSLIHNGYDEEDFVDLGYKTKNSKFTIGYNGTFSRVVPIEPLMTAIKKIHQHHGISICLSIATPIKKDKLESRFSYLFENDLIDYKGFLPHRNSLENIYHSDISALILNDIDATKGMLPAKTFEYLRIGNPILVLHLKHGHLSDIIDKTKTGIVVNITNHNDIVSVLLELHKKWSLNNQSYQPDWNEIKKYECRNIIKQLTDIFNNITY